MFKDDQQDYTDPVAKNLLFSTSLSTALGVALQGGHSKTAPKQDTSIKIAPRDQVKVDTELAATQLTYLKAQKNTQRAQADFEQGQVRLKVKSQRNQQIQQLLQVQELTITPQKRKLQQQLDQQQQTLKTQENKLQQAYTHQVQQTRQQQAQVQAYETQLQDSQNSVTPENAQVQSALAYYSQQKQIATQQLQQQQQNLLQLKTQIQVNRQQQQQGSVQWNQEIAAQITRQKLYHAKIADLQAQSEEAEETLTQLQGKIQQALMQEDNTFKELTAVRQKHSVLSPEQQALFEPLPSLQAPDELLSVTHYQNRHQATLKAATTATEKKLQFAPPAAIPGYALDLDRSVLLTDQEVVGSLWDLMDELETEDPVFAVAQLNAASVMTTGRSNRSLLCYVYQRQITLVTKYQVTRNRVDYQIEATKVEEDKSDPQFLLPATRSDYRLDWSHCRLTLDHFDKNYLASYLVAANGHGPEALTMLNEDITKNRLIATKLILTYQYVDATQPLQAETQSVKKIVDTTKIKAFGPNQSMEKTGSLPRNIPKVNIPNSAPKQVKQTSELFKSQAQLTRPQRRPQPAKVLFGGPKVTETRLLGTYGIRKINQGTHLVNKIMPRKY